MISLGNENQQSLKAFLCCMKANSTQSICIKSTQYAYLYMVKLRTMYRLCNNF